MQPVPSSWRRSSGCTTEVAGQSGKSQPGHFIGEDPKKWPCLQQGNGGRQHTPLAPWEGPDVRELPSGAAERSCQEDRLFQLPEALLPSWVGQVVGLIQSTGPANKSASAAALAAGFVSPFERPPLASLDSVKPSWRRALGGTMVVGPTHSPSFEDSWAPC